ncbi:MAG: PD-(D/E)XK nuclease family protein [Elusimicrobiota bacterium]
MSEYLQDEIFSYNPENKGTENKKIKILNEEKFHFSYSKMSLYLECPLKYKFKYVDKLKEKPKPFFVFGRIIHSVLEFFYSRVPPPSVEELITFFKKKWDEVPPEEKNYRLPRYEQEAFEEGIRIIKNFHFKHRNNDKIPFLLEHSTVVNIDGIAAQIVADKIEYDGNGLITIVDYKTGKDGGRSNDQLYFYQKICESDPQIIEKIAQKYKVSIKKVEVNKMIYYYVQSLKEVAFERAKDSEINHFWEKVMDTVDKIKSKKFDPSPSDLACSYCDFKSLCPVMKDVNLKKNSKITELIKIDAQINEFMKKRTEIEKEIIKEMAEKDSITIKTENEEIIVNKTPQYEFKDRDKLINILKDNNLYEKVLKPTVKSVIEILNDEDISDEIKQKIKNISNVSYQIQLLRKKKE